MIVTVDGLRLAVERYQTARIPMKAAMRNSATAQAIALADERDRLVTRMDKRWGWCAANEGHDQFIDREDALIADIATYELIEDALKDAARVLLEAA